MASCSTNSHDGRLATLTVTVASQSIENNQTTLSWELKVSGGKVNYYNAYDITAWVDGTDNAHRVYGPVDKAWDSYAFPAAKGTKTGTIVIDHNADGTHGQVQIRIRGSFYTNSPSNHDAYLDIPTIPRASNVSCDNVTLGNSVTINCPRASTGFTNTLYIKDGNTTIETFSGIGDSKSWTPTLANYGNRIVLSKQFTIQCDTYSGGTYIGTKYCYPTLSFPSGYGPTCSLSVSPNNSNCPSAWGNRYVQYKSMVNVSVGFSGQYGATLSSRTSTVPNAGTNSSASWVSNTLSTNGTLTVTASVTDNRNRTANASQQITVYPYFSPRITRALAERNDNTLTCTYSYEIASVNGANAHNFKIEYKKVSDSTWTTAVNNTSDLSKTNATATVNNLDANSSYDIRFTVTDSTGSITQTASIGTAFDLMNFHSSGLAMAIGKMSEAGANEKLFEVGIPAKLYDVTYLKNNSSHGFTWDVYGNWQHTDSCASDNWSIKKNDGTQVFTLYPESGRLKLASTINTVTTHSGTHGNNGIWCKLVNIAYDSHNQGEFTYLKIMLGAGNNGTGDQNAYIDLYLQLGYTGSVDGRHGCYAFLNPCATSFSSSTTYLKIIANSRTNYDIWLYTNKSYCVPNTIVCHSGNAQITKYYITQSSAPSGTECNLIYDEINRNTIKGAMPTRTSQLTNDSGFLTNDANSIGTSGIWTYIKFNNGYAICFGTYEFSATINTTWGNLKNASGAISPPNFPFTFTTIPTVTMSPTNTANTSYMWMIGNNGATNVGPSTTNPGRFMASRGSGASSSQKYAVAIIAIGKWK